MLVFAASPAHAHKLKVFAAPVGAQIEGSAYFVGGGPARGARVVVETTGGQPLVTLQADEEGRFAYSATMRADQVIVVDAGDGHSARFTIAAGDLPESVAPPPGMPAPAAGVPASPVAAAQAGVPLEDLVGQAVARQVRPLREQLNAYEDQVRLRDIMGGIGYILGIAGLTMWFRSRRREGAGG